MNIIFIGHVDSGKSTIAGHILLMKGMIGEREFTKIEKEAIEQGMERWKYARILDISEEERAHGKTVQVAREHFFIGDKKITILDAPGHKSYVSNMVVGCTQADVGILVVSIKKGEFESGFVKNGQTKEHVIIAKMYIKRLMVVINKMDTIDWDMKQYDEVVKELQLYLFKTVGYNKDNVSFLPIAGYDGKGLAELIETIDKIDIKRDYTNIIIPIIDVYKEKGNTVILGKVESGIVSTDLYVNNMKCKVIGEGNAGDNVKLIVKCENEIIPGMVIHNGNVPMVSEFIAEIVIIADIMIVNGYKCMIHIHTAIEQITLILDKYAKKGDKIKCICKLSRPICMDKYENNKSVGRFILRDIDTIGIGKVMKIKKL